MVDSQKLCKCSKCGKRKKEFPSVTRSYRLKNGEVRYNTYKLSYCLVCLRRQKREAERNRAPRKRKLTPEQKRIANARSSSKAARRRYRQTLKGKQADKRTKKKAQAKLKARIPTPVIQPFVEQMVRRAGTLRAVAEATGVHERRLREILRGRTKSVSIPICDSLSLHAEFTLQELVERAEEWALLTGNSWPRI